jgi:hypothetical protein
MRPGPLSFTSGREQRESNRQSRNTASRSTDGPGSAGAPRTSPDGPRVRMKVSRPTPSAVYP